MAQALHPIEASALHARRERVFLMPVGDIHGLTPGARVQPLSGSRNTPVGEALLGRVVDRIGKGIRGAPRDALLAEGLFAADKNRPHAAMTHSF